MTRPFQIHDVDGDGRNEVVVVRDFKLQVLDGRTGKVKQWAWMPKAPAAPVRPYELVSGDSITFVNVSGDKRRREILLKDRYQNFWVYKQQSSKCSGEAWNRLAISRTRRI